MAAKIVFPDAVSNIAQNTPFDIVGLGCAAVDEVLFIDTYPPPDTKVRILGNERRCGGLTAVALLAARRLGSTCAYAGILGDEELSGFVLNSLDESGVDIQHVLIRPGARPVYATILVDSKKQTRTIFYSLEGTAMVDQKSINTSLVLGSKVLLVDHMGTEGMIHAARLARENGIAVVGDIEDTNAPRLNELLAMIDHLIIPREIAKKITGESIPGAATRKLWTRERKVVVVTCGDAGCWYFSGWQPEHLPASQVNVVDTTGCGDVFHGGYAAALARGLGIDQSVRVASAAAAMKARGRGLRELPDWGELEKFMQGNESS